MPYDINNPPDKIKKLSPRKQRQWVHVYNSCWSKDKDEGKCHAMAWGTVNKTASSIEDALIVLEKALGIVASGKSSRERYDEIMIDYKGLAHVTRGSTFQETLKAFKRLPRKKALKLIDDLERDNELHPDVIDYLRMKL